MKEIGSEFWLTKELLGIVERKKGNVDFRNVPDWLRFGEDNKLLLSGRTAIDYVLKDIIEQKEVKTVYFPSYCCQSMIQPFIENGIEIKFYEVYFDGKGLKYNINLNQQCDIFFAMNYFGYRMGRMDSFIEHFKKNNSIIIEDSTHTLLSRKIYNSNSDYIIVSLRKWFPVLSGGLAVKANGKFKINIKKFTLDKMALIKKEAMLEKGRYINGDITINKESFLRKYKEANKMISNNYTLLRIDEISYKILETIDLEFIINKRIKNTIFLYKYLQKFNWIDFLFPYPERGDCPIFVPILIKDSMRNFIRNYLISNNIYCPVHWPKPSLIKEDLKLSIYNTELSLINDQRYDEISMEYQIRGLEQAYANFKLQ